MLVAKAFAYSELSTYFVSLHRLVYMLEDDDGRQKLERVDNLFIDHFEKTFHDSSTFPYSHRERANIEEFIKSRQRQTGKATFFSATKAWGQLKWWSAELIQDMQPIMVDVSVAG
jgi:hypothetical protein